MVGDADIFVYVDNVSAIAKYTGSCNRDADANLPADATAAFSSSFNMTVGPGI